MFCVKCGGQLQAGATFCSNCGTPVTSAAPMPGGAPTQPGYAPQYPAQKSKVAAGVLGILLGGLGIHKFYLGKVGAGIIYLLLCWTYIPAIIGLIEGIIYLTQDDRTFAAKLEANRGKFWV